MNLSIHLLKYNYKQLQLTDYMYQVYISCFKFNENEKLCNGKNYLKTKEICNFHYQSNVMTSPISRWFLSYFVVHYSLQTTCIKCLTK